MSEVDAFADGEIDAPKQKKRVGRPPRKVESFEDAIKLGKEMAVEEAKEEAKKNAVIREKPRAELMGGVPNPSDPNLKRIKIILEESQNIPKGGQFFCVNGYTALLKPGREAKVPEAIVNVLNDSIERVAVKDQDDKVIDYRNMLRFPYRNLGPV